ETLAADLLPELAHLLFGDAALQIGTRIDSGGGMPLKIDEVAAKAVARRAEEMIESHVVKRSRRSEARDMPPKLGRFLVRAHHHRHRVPADERTDLVLEVGVACIVVCLGHWISLC